MDLYYQSDFPQIIPNLLKRSICARSNGCKYTATLVSPLCGNMDRF
jgi:hypothetical protein